MPPNREAVVRRTETEAGGTVLADVVLQRTSYLSPLQVRPNLFPNSLLLLPPQVMSLGLVADHYLYVGTLAHLGAQTRS